MRHLAWIAAALVTTAPAPPAPLDAPLAHFPLPVPFDRCAVGATVADLALAAGISFGFERLAERCEESAPAGPSLDLTDVTPRQVLDDIAVLAPDYAWRDVDGVVVMRPAQAWADTRHFLATTKVAGFTATGAHVASALAAISKPFAPFGFPALDGWLVGFHRELPDFTATFEGGTLLDALDALIRARSDLSWRLQYCGDDPTLAHARLNVACSWTGGDGRRFDMLLPMLDPHGHHPVCGP